MKRALVYSLLGSLLLSANASAQNLLTNPNFETGDLTGWHLLGPGGSQTIGAPGIGAQSGSFAVKLNAPSDGVPEVGQGIFGSPTSFPASAGQEFKFSGYMLTEVALPAVGTGATFGLFKIVFEDAAGVDLVPASASIGLINTAFPGVESQPFLDGNSAPNTWIFSEAQGVAPAGTASVAFLVLNVDFANGANHPMWFDNISATKVTGASGLVGDYSNNGTIDAADYTAWKNAFNGSTLPNLSPTKVGTTIDASDYTVWRDKLPPAVAAAAAVPEPSLWAWMVVAGVTVVGSRRRSAR